jgi:hypothetical protein
MGIKETIRGLGCMVKAICCLLAIIVAISLVFGLIYGVIIGGLCVVLFVQEHSDFFLPILGCLFLAVIVAIILAIANAIGKNTD